MYDFTLDGGMKSQVFEGKDYSDRNNQREVEPYGLSFAFIDPGKRERRPIATYSETVTRAVTDESDKRPKLPKHLRLPKMEDWQFYDKSRLLQLQDEEIRLFDQYLLEQGSNLPTKISSLLPEELHHEKIQLLDAAFADWTKVQFNNYIRASAKHGRYNFDKIAKDIHKPIDEIKRYSETFWSKGAAAFPTADWERIVKSIEKVRYYLML